MYNKPQKMPNALSFPISFSKNSKESILIIQFYSKKIHKYFFELIFSKKNLFYILKYNNNFLRAILLKLYKNLLITLKNYINLNYDKIFLLTIIENFIPFFEKFHCYLQFIFQLLIF